MKRKFDPSPFGAEVRRRREAQGITLEILAERSGLTPNYIGGIELGRRDPSISTILALAKGLRVPAGELLGGTREVGPAALEMGRDFDGLSHDQQISILLLLRALSREPSKKPRRQTA